MAVARGATPLIGLDAVVLDTETTGLDPHTARIVEIGAVRLVRGRLDTGQSFRRLVRPEARIPASATRIHGIDDKAVATAPRFAEAWPELAAYCGDAVLVGHTLGFDVAVLKRECARAGGAFHAPLTLDVRLLAQVAEPNLAEYSLESLAAWLGVEMTGRHSALGDATTAGRIFCALVPKLRGRGIRTLAEAMRASQVLAGAPGAGTAWEQGAAPELEPATENFDTRPDAYPYRHRVAAIMTKPAQTVLARTSISATLECLARERISSVFVVPDTDGRTVRAEDIGIVTERDILRALSERGASALTLPVERIMSHPLHVVPASAFAYHAIARMNRLRIRHLGVTDDTGKVIGALSARDLLKLRAENAIELGDELDQAKDVHEIAGVWGKLAHVCTELVREGLSAREIAAVISHELMELTRRAVVLAESGMKHTGLGEAPCAYALMVLGSAGRGESLLAMDQDNALVFADGAPDGADRWFADLAERVADVLHQVGVPYCKGGVMAKNPQWRGSVTAWRQRVDGWIRRSNPQDLLSVDIFFDAQGVHGDLELASELTRYAFDTARGQVAFAKLLLETAGGTVSARTWFGGFRTDNGRLDLKKAGLFGVVSAVRALAICQNVTERTTPARIDGLKALHPRADRDLDALVDAHGTFLELILEQQIADIERGLPPTNAVEVRRLSRRQRERLRAALRAVEHMDDMARDLLFKV